MKRNHVRINGRTVKRRTVMRRVHKGGGIWDFIGPFVKTVGKAIISNPDAQKAAVATGLKGVEYVKNKLSGKGVPESAKPKQTISKSNQAKLNKLINGSGLLYQHK